VYWSSKYLGHDPYGDEHKSFAPNPNLFVHKISWIRLLDSIKILIHPSFKLSLLMSWREVHDLLLEHIQLPLVGKEALIF